MTRVSLVGLDPATNRLPSNVSVKDESLYLPYYAQDNDLAFPTDLSGDCSAALLGAISAAAAVTQGRKSLVLPPGRIRCDVPLGRIPRDVLIAGPTGRDARGCSLEFGSNLHDAAIRGGLVALEFETPTFANTCVLAGLTISGAPSNPAASATPPEEWGTAVRCHSGTLLRDVTIGGFCYGLDWRGDHNAIRDSSLTGWAGLFLGPRDVAVGDGQIDNLNTTGTWCGVACSHSHYLGGAIWIGGHIAGSQYAFWKQAWTRRDANYSTGTVSTTSGSRVVTGSGTAWLANVKRGSHLLIGGAGYYPIHSVDSDTQITLISTVGSTFSGAYVIQESASSIADTQFIGGNKFYDVAQEGLALGLMKGEDRGAVSGNIFDGCDQSGSAYGSAYGTADAAVVAPDGYNDNKHRNATWWGGYLTAGIIVGTPGSNGVSRNDFGEIGLEVAELSTRGIPFAASASGGAMLCHSNVCLLRGARGKILSTASTPVARGELVQATHGTSAGFEVQSQRVSGKLPRGVAYTTAPANAGVVLQVEGVATVNVAQSVIVSVLAAIGATTLTVLDTTVLGAAATAVTLIDSAGATRATGTVATGTTITVTALATAIAKGTQLWIQRTAPITTNGDVVKARFGASSGGTANTDRGQVLPATTFADTDAAVIGEAATYPSASDNGRTTNVLLKGLA